MNLPQVTIRKIIKELPASTEKPICVKGEKQQREFLEQWRKEIEKAHNGCKVEVTHYQHFQYVSPIMTLDLQVKMPERRSSYYSRRQTFDLKFRKDELHFIAGDSGEFEIPISSFDHLSGIIDIFRQKLLEKVGREQKLQKVRDLRANSVEAQVEDLAQRLQFAYQLDRRQIKVILIVQINKQRSIYIDIPLSKFQEIIDRLEALIQQVRSLYAEGLRIKIASPPLYGQFQQPPKPAS